jgi:predicted Zn-dependent peptidase
MLFHSKYDIKEINRERGVIIEEINMYEDNPQMHIEDLLEDALFPNSTLGWSILGPKKVIQRVTRKQLIDYRDRYYIPSRLTIALAGKIPDNVMKLLGSTFGKVNQPKRSKDSDFKPFCAPRKLKDSMNVQEKVTEQTQVGIAFHGYSWAHKDEPAVKILSAILGGSMSSRLFIQVRERRGLCYAISSYHESLEDTGIFGIYAGLDRKRLKEAVETIMDEIDKMKKSGVTSEELKRAKDHLSGKITLAFEDSSFQTGWYGMEWMFTGALETPEERMKQFNSVTTKDIKRVANAIFRRDAMANAVIGPQIKRGALEKYFDLE